MLDEILAIPDHVRDALWRVESARLEPSKAAGLIVCGVGGSAIGAELATAALGSRLERPLVTVRGYRLPSWVTPDWAVLFSSYSGRTEEVLACFDAASELATRRIVVSTGGPLVEAARAADAPVIGLPGILQPRSAVGYMFVAAAQVAAVVGACPDLAAEVEEAATFLSIHIEDLRAQAAEVVSQMEGGLPVVYGADLTIPVARRWKTQINENAKLPAFFSELPEADHNEICSWVGVGAAGESITVVMLRDADQNQREQRRFELTAEKIVAGGASVVEVVTRGSSRVARMLWGTMLGDLVSVGLAEAHGVDPVEVEAIEQFKVAMGTPRR